MLKACEIKNDVYWCGALDPNLRIFDIIMYTPFGTTYNSYVIKGKNKTAIVETVKEKFFDEYLERLQSINVELKDVDYIILNHTEPDHAGSLAKILKLAPKAKVVASRTAIKFLKEITNSEFAAIEAKEGEILDLGGKSLRFVSAPFLHWPDSIYTYLEEDEMLFTCDSFGCHYCNPNIFNDLNANEKDYKEALKYYFDNIMGPFKPHMLKAIDKIKDFKINFICSGHGPVLRKNPWDIVEQYKNWSLTENIEGNHDNVTICYVSAYGYTEKLAKKIAEGIESFCDLKVNTYDVIKSDMNEILDKINISKGILFGSPTINGDVLKPIWEVLINLSPIVHGGKFASAFGSFGWSGEAIPNIMDRLKQLRMNLIEPLKVNFNPSDEDLKKAFKFGEDFGMKLRESLNKDQPKCPVSKKRLWKCLVCGEVFEGDTPPDICPACGAGADQFVEVIEETINFLVDKEENIVILGNGAAGYYAADAIRKRNKVCHIKMISEETKLTYYRPSLSDLLAEAMPDNKFYLSQEQWYKENKIELSLGTKVKNLKLEEKKVILEDKKEISFDKLILANGSSNFIPPIKGVDKKGVFTLRNMNDLNNIKQWLNHSKSLVVIGGGLLGLEAAFEMKKLGLDVTVVEAADHLLSKQLDDQGAEILMQGVNKENIKVFVNAQLTEIQGEEIVTGIKLNNGEEIKADMILLSIGIRSNIELIKDTDIDINRSVVVNEKMETNIKDVYACGDVCELRGRCYGNWPAAIEMGTVAGTNAVGDETVFKDFVDVISFSAMNTELLSCGNIPKETSQVIAVASKERRIYKKFFFKDNVLVAGILMGDISDSIKLINGVKNKEEFNSFSKKVNLNIY